MVRTPSVIVIAVSLLAAPLQAQTRARASEPAALSIGETFTIESAALGETRRINVHAPAAYSDSPELRLPVLYMPDGGIGEDFLHVAGLVEISVMNGTMRPFLLVGIENTQRRRDLTGPTADPEDRAIAPEVGGSAAFRRFVREELMPVIETRYRTTEETAIIGESLAGLFIVETFFLEPDLFDAYIAFDPSLWWNGGQLVNRAADWLKNGTDRPRTLYLASSAEPELAELTSRMAELLEQHAGPRLTWHYEPMPHETHASIYHPAALLAFRRLFAPAANGSHLEDSCTD